VEQSQKGKPRLQPGRKVKLSVKRGKHKPASARKASPAGKPRPALDLKRLSNEALTQLLIDVGTELDRRSPVKTGEIRSAELSSESDKDKLRAAVEKFKQDLRAFYEDGGALRAFDELGSAGCDPEFLFYTVGAIRLAYQFHAGPDSFENLAGSSRKKLKTVIGRLRDCAKDIAHLRVDFLARLVPNAHQQLARYMELQSRLPSELDELAGVTEEAARRLRLRGRPDYDTVIAGLVRHVEERTAGKLCDPQVSALIAFARNNPAFTAEDLRTWRMEHRDLLQANR
jgi:hypothetical protein